MSPPAKSPPGCSGRAQATRVTTGLPRCSCTSPGKNSCWPEAAQPITRYKLTQMKRRDWMKQALVLPALATGAQDVNRSINPERAANPPTPDEIVWGNSHVRLQVEGSAEALWTFTAGSKTVAITPPSFMIDGNLRTAVLRSPKRLGPPQELGNNISEQRFLAPFAHDPALNLEIVFRLAHDSPIVRFRYVLHAANGAKLTGDGAQLKYLGLSLADMPHCIEIQLSAFNDLLHSYTLAELPIAPRNFQDELEVIGPILVSSSETTGSLLLAYEHGAQSPDSFLSFKLDANRNVALKAKKTNYIPGQNADGYSTVWMQTAAVDGGMDDLATKYRSYILHGLNTGGASRSPYIFYNTWNFQERNKWFNHKPYISSMNPERVLAEIDVAHRLGIDVFVMDTGWYEKTGDWNVSRSRFPDGLKEISTRLQNYGMKLGLWFDPTAAAKSSRMLAETRNCVRTVNGQEGAPKTIWETEESFSMCLVSPYSNLFAETLIHIARETGARYFKWDAIAQYGCDSEHHWHGVHANTREERWNSYAFQLPQQMARVAERVAAAIPDIIIDFDVTEAGRAVGLSFLSIGKYFLINNGPYLFDYDLPLDRDRQNWNLFFYPGPARTWICRSPLSYDRWLPSILFLTHYLPDDPQSSQLVNLGSLILGQNGIWGDLPAVSPEGIKCINAILTRYKTIRDDMTESSPFLTGAVGTSPEIHEKISAETGKGAVVLFSTRLPAHSGM